MECTGMRNTDTATVDVGPPRAQSLDCIRMRDLDCVCRGSLSAQCSGLNQNMNFISELALVLVFASVRAR